MRSIICRIVAGLLTLCAVTIVAQTPGHPQPATSRVPIDGRPPKVPDPVLTPQEISLLLSGTTSATRILLTLNNNHKTNLVVSNSIFTAEGREVALPQITLSPFESRIIELNPILSSAGVDGETLGYIKLNYSGFVLGLGAQLTLYPSSQGSGVDSPRSLAIDFSSGGRQAAFWMFAESQATVAMTNVSTTPLSVHFACGSMDRTLVIGGHATSIQRFTLEETSHGGTWLTKAHKRGAPISCDVESVGDVTNLRVVGTVTREGGQDAPIRFYDIAASTSRNITAPDLRTSAETYISVHNTTDHSIDVVATLRETTLEAPRSSKSPIQRIEPRATIALSVSEQMNELRKQGVPSATLTVDTQSPPGSLVASATQVGDGLVEDIPLRTANPRRYAAGAYPLRWDEDYTNRVSVTNTTDHALRTRALVTAGNVTYTLPIETILPGRTKIYDVDQMRKDQVKDVNGYLLPLDAISGKFMWSGYHMGEEFGLMGRNSVTSVANHRKSSFSCGFPCSFNSDTYPVFLDTYPVQYVPYGSSFGSRIVEVLDTGGPVYQYPYSFSSSALASSNTGVLSYGADPSVSTSYAAAAVNYGNTFVSYLYSYEYPTQDQFGDCDYPGPTSYPTGGNGGVQTPTSVVITANSLFTYNNQTASPCGADQVNGAYGYARCLEYTVQDQNNAPIRKGFQIHEAVSFLYASSPTDGYQADGASNTDGIFSDKLAIIASSPIPANYCAKASQSITADGITVRVNCLTYTNANVSIQDITTAPNSCSTTCP